MAAREMFINNVMEKDKKKTLTISSNLKKKLIQVLFHHQEKNLSQ